MGFDLSRYIIAHQRDYQQALFEIKCGRKITHWMWYIFPQLKGLGKSFNSEYYGIVNLEEAKAFLDDETLGSHLIEISKALLQVECNDACIVMGRSDDKKLKSCMTLFSVAAPHERIFAEILDKFFNGKQDRRTLSMLGISTDFASGEHTESHNDLSDRIIHKDDSNISELRKRYPNGLHFVVGDTHGQYSTLQLLMEKIEFDPQKDFVYFVGDYNFGGNPDILLRYISKYYQDDYSMPGFHLIRGNHERELCPLYALSNLPDILVVKGRFMTYYLTHAGMVQDAFDLINADLKDSPDEKIHGYTLDEKVTCYDAPFRQIIWSRRGLYSQRSHYHVWPSEDKLHEAKACIIHGHTPFSQLKKGNYFSYGDKMLLWEKQRIWFAEDLQSFNIDSNAKGKFAENDSYRGLSCVCLEVLDEIAEKNNCTLTREGIKDSENFVFAMPHVHNAYINIDGDLSRVLNAKPLMKCIGLDKNGNPYIYR